jgi:hypothetical protein
MICFPEGSAFQVLPVPYGSANQQMNKLGKFGFECTGKSASRSKGAKHGPALTSCHTPLMIPESAGERHQALPVFGIGTPLTRLVKITLVPKGSRTKVRTSAYRRGYMIYPGIALIGLYTIQVGAPESNQLLHSPPLHDARNSKNRCPRCTHMKFIPETG